MPRSATLARQLFRLRASTATKKKKKLKYYINAFWWDCVFAASYEENSSVSSVNIEFGTALHDFLIVFQQCYSC